MAIAISAQRPAPAARDHFVQFYDKDESLLPGVARFLEHGLTSGCAAVMIADAVHTHGVFELWRNDGFDYQSARKRGQLVVLDAAETLSRFMRDGYPDPVLFERSVGEVVRSALARDGDLMAYGEMVALLWADGRHEAAVALENLWNDLASRHRFSLYCAYPMQHCASAEASRAFGLVCHAHSHVMPAESLVLPNSEAEQLKLITQLHQKALALEQELKKREQAEAALRARERDFSDFVENAVVGLHRVGADGTILWANRAELDLLGYEPEEYIGHHISEFHADHDLICSILETLAGGGRLKDHAARLRCKDGSVKHVLINSNAQMEDGRFVATRCFTRDVTDRWLAQEALRERGAVLHLALQGARMGYWVGDFQSNTVRCSPEMAMLLGMPNGIDDTLDAFLQRMHPDDREPFRDSLLASVETRTMFAAEFRAHGQGPEWRWFEARGEAIYDGDDVPVRFYGTCTDITRRRHQDYMLRHFAAVVDCAKDAIISCRLDGTIMSWNAAAGELYGYSADEIMGKSIELIIPPELRDEDRTTVAKVAAGHQVERYITRRQAKDGTMRAVSLAVSPIRDASGRMLGVTKMAREVTA